MAENRASANGTGYREGVPCWVDAQLPDVEAGKRFYGELFGWTFEEAYDSTVWALKDGERVAALARKADGRLPTVWTVYFATPDAGALGERIRSAGGQVVIPPTPIGTGLGSHHVMVGAGPRREDARGIRCTGCAGTARVAPGDVIIWG